VGLLADRLVGCETPGSLRDISRAGPHVGQSSDRSAQSGCVIQNPGPGRTEAVPDPDSVTQGPEPQPPAPWWGFVMLAVIVGLVLWGVVTGSYLGGRPARPALAGIQLARHTTVRR
jgi:hypothetical protein